MAFRSTRRTARLLSNLRYHETVRTLRIYEIIGVMGDGAQIRTTIDAMNIEDAEREAQFRYASRKPVSLDVTFKQSCTCGHRSECDTCRAIEFAQNRAQ